MFAIFEDGSHQHQVQVGDTLTVDYRQSAGEGDALVFDRVLLANDGEKSSIGQPTIESASIEAEVVEHGDPFAGIGDALPDGFAVVIA